MRRPHTPLTLDPFYKILKKFIHEATKLKITGIRQHHRQDRNITRIAIRPRCYQGDYKLGNRLWQFARHSFVQTYAEGYRENRDLLFGNHRSLLSTATPNKEAKTDGSRRANHGFLGNCRRMFEQQKPLQTTRDDCRAYKPPMNTSEPYPLPLGLYLARGANRFP